MEKTPALVPGMSIAVLGFGGSGQAIARYLAECGAKVLVSDARQFVELHDREQALLRRCSAEFEGGGHSEAFLERAEKIIVSPGVDPRSVLFEKLQESGVELLGELALAAPHFQAPVIGITGTNGKTTVTELVGELLRSAGKKVFVGGNIGTPIGEYLLSPAGYDVIVLELSSFQLEMSGSFVPEVALLLNLSPDHLNRHGSLEGYARAKMRIFAGNEKQQLAVMSGDDELCLQFQGLAGRDQFSLFGHDRDFAASVSGNSVVLAGKGTEGRKIVYDLGGSGLGSLSGRMNTAAALLAVQPFLSDTPAEVAARQQVLSTFSPGEHRMQEIASVAGITCINDSKATNTGAVISALRQVGGPALLLAGGRHKGDDYRLLRSAVKDHVKKLILIGEAAPKIAEALEDLVAIDHARTMQEAVDYAVGSAVAGDTVLLSPACASFDMFDSYADRGHCFAEAVKKALNAMEKETL